MNGNILNIQRFCTRDGPGIRTTVFLKGCPLQCIWCHNPESQSGRSQLLYDAEKCVNCLKCVRTCLKNCHTAVNGAHRFSPADCHACGSCLSPLCDALELSGKVLSTDAILQEVLQDRLFYENSGGGMTVSGGEPLSQADFCLELLQKAKKHGLHTCMETCGFADSAAVKESARYTDLYLFDCKETDSSRHKAFTGADNSLILENLRLLDRLGKRIILRCPIIPTQNDRKEHFVGIATLANSLKNLMGVVIEPYHTFGTSKYRRLGRSYALKDVSAPNDKTVDLWITEIQRLTAIPVSKA